VKTGIPEITAQEVKKMAEVLMTIFLMPSWGVREFEAGFQSAKFTIERILNVEHLPG
jgi:hypothetical protein